MNGDSRSAERGLKDLGRDVLSDTLRDLGLPGYRTSQILRWAYRSGVHSYAEMSNLPLPLRENLEAALPLKFPTVESRQVSSDGTRKYLLRFDDGVSVETVGLPADDRLTVCFSTQAGCAIGCSFCATGASGLTRNLAPGEMVDQLTIVGQDFGQRVTNAVAMGQGEPFANYDALMEALRIINSGDGPGIGARHITVSTCGLIPGIRRLAAEPEQFTLAVSLHSAVQETRDALMPGVKGMRLNELRDAIADYTAATGRRCSLEFAMIEGVNDTRRELEALVGFCHAMLVHVNLIPVNPTSGGSFDRPAGQSVERFAASLARSGIEVSVRAERGADIDAACGQLRQRSS